MATESQSFRTRGGRRPVFSKNAVTESSYIALSNSLERKNFVKLKRDNCFTWLSSERGLWLYQGIVRDEKLYFFLNI